MDEKWFEARFFFYNKHTATNIKSTRLLFTFTYYLIHVAFILHTCLDSRALNHFKKQQISAIFFSLSPKKIARKLRVYSKDGQRSSFVQLRRVNRWTIKFSNPIIDTYSISRPLSRIHNAKRSEFGAMGTYALIYDVRVIFSANNLKDIRI